jgi:hypothetical protein
MFGGFLMVVYGGL